MPKSHALDTIPANPAHQPHGNIPNTPLAISTISFILGGIFSLGLLTFLVGGFEAFWWATYQLGFFVAAWAAFHWGEFAVTAGWNKDKCSVDSFLLDNGAMYHVANGVAVLEYLVTLYLKPSLKSYPSISALGILMVIVGQTLRSTAMIHASTNFSHSVAFQRLETHQLVTDGVYRWFRHPSYAGFFYWALGTQLLLLNPVSFTGFAVVLWRFFYYRTRAEERALVKFFGDAYVEYRKRVGTRIPFIP
ncbi:ICMT-domain-containing protein [Gloeophyllum trabeum ATCC 11539]|uniref:Protein-S-isoprenylcysteine O-methyltransferase n=1 Tax=Gloeophyllum trabeum (strain ATCC 11539 / FP-39264 / Madison 617) TaxID=670483 RepID=S7QJG8_GLOTA|nr:ICMT-domain-containing protein [Gloeophyllum trabeum ATCC 11539]EPQ59473.1 ICMT-domain-containing protein [Gloeophyllum trabeum ATCC 11539]